jgi:hypothetical protein
VNSIGAHGWVSSGLNALGISSDKITQRDEIFHRHLSGTQTKSVNFVKLIALLPEGAISTLREQFPQISTKSKTDAEFLYAVMCQKPGIERPTTSFSHGRVLFRQTPARLDTTFQQPTHNLSRSQIASSPKIISKPQPTLRRSSLSPSAATIPSSIATSTVTSAENRQRLTSATRLDLMQVKPNGTFIFQDQNKREISTKDISFLSECKNLSTLNFKNAPDVSELDLSACTKLQHLNLSGCCNLKKVALPPGRGAMDAHGSIQADSCPAFPKGMNIKMLQTESSGESGPLIFEKTKLSTTQSATKTAMPASTASADVDQRLLVAKHLELKRMDNGKYVINTGNGTIEVQDLSFLSQCENLENLVINEPMPTLQNLDLRGCQNLQHFECRWCDNLSEVHFHPGAVLQSVEFQDCKNLRNVTLPVERSLQTFSGDGCPALAGIMTNVHIQVIANMVSSNTDLGKPENAARKDDTALRGIGLQITCHKDGTTTFSAPEPTKRKSFFSRLFGRK